VLDHLVPQVSGYVIYEGPSVLDDAPIVMIATDGSSNRKTGDMIQTWILRSDVKPMEAVKDGRDASICGECKHRGELGKGRSCYVTVHQAPNSVFAAYKRGVYAPFPGPHVFLGRKIRLGAYGDPAAVPYDVLFSLTRGSIGWTGYTHAWKRADPRLRHLCMASCDSVEEHLHAAGRGWRVFRTRLPEERDTPRLDGEALCPASEEAGHKLTCEQCMACGGVGLHGRRGHIVISAHGSTGIVANYKRNFGSIPIVAEAS
jgi:hypothetical protein